jgi:adenylate kinase
VQRPDDHEDKVRARLAAYHRDTTAVVPYYEKKGLVRKVNGLGALDDVFTRLAQAIDGP